MFTNKCGCLFIAASDSAAKRVHIDAAGKGPHRRVFPRHRTHNIFLNGFYDNGALLRRFTCSSSCELGPCSAHATQPLALYDGSLVYVFWRTAGQYLVQRVTDGLSCRSRSSSAQAVALHLPSRRRGQVPALQLPCMTYGHINSQLCVFTGLLSCPVYSCRLAPCLSTVRPCGAGAVRFRLTAIICLAIRESRAADLSSGSARRSQSHRSAASRRVELHVSVSNSAANMLQTAHSSRCGRDMRLRACSV